MFLIRLLSKLPLPVLYIFSDCLFFISFYLVRYRRNLVRKNLSNCFPETSDEYRRNIEKDFYKNLCDYAVESVKLVTMTKEELGRRMRFNDPEVPENYKRNNQSILFLASHQFNWEWLLVAASASFPMPIDFVYQPISSRFFDDVILQVRTRFGAHPIKRNEVARELVRRKDVVRGIASVADQYPGYGRDKKYLTTFLNQETAFFMGTNQLAHLSQFPAVYYSVRKVKRGYYEAQPIIIASPPYQKDDQTVIENYVRTVEQVVRENPSGWLWSHNRWKKRHLRKQA